MESTQTETQYVKDEEFFSKPIAIPSGKSTDSQRSKVAKQLESAFDTMKTKFKKVVFVADGVGNDVLSLTADNVTKEECILLMKSDVINQLRSIGFKTFSCRDRQTGYMFSSPIK